MQCAIELSIEEKAVILRGEVVERREHSATHSRLKVSKAVR